LIHIRVSSNELKIGHAKVLEIGLIGAQDALLSRSG
jgi:hypothetical protein